MKVMSNVLLTNITARESKGRECTHHSRFLKFIDQDFTNGHHGRGRGGSQNTRTVYLSVVELEQNISNLSLSPTDHALLPNVSIISIIPLPK